MDHQPSANEAALRMPSLSANQPPGKLKSAYANPQMNEMRPICVDVEAKLLFDERDRDVEVRAIHVVDHDGDEHHEENKIANLCPLSALERRILQVQRARGGARTRLHSAELPYVSPPAVSAATCRYC